MLAASDDLARSQRRGDTECGRIGGADRGPRRSGEDRPGPIRPAHEALGGVELGMRPGTPSDVLHRRAAAALLVIEQAGTSRDQRVKTGAVPMPGMVAITRDRA